MRYAQRLLLLEGHGLSVFLWTSGVLLREAEFPASEQGFQDFLAFLAVDRRYRYTLLANLAEESHQVETIPFLRGADREALIGRRMAQHFQGTPYHAATSLGFEKTTRKNELLLLSALTQPALIDPWLQRIALAEVPFAGIQTLSQLGGPLLGQLIPPIRRALLLTLHNHGIRESHLVDGQLQFSRLAPLADSSLAGQARGFANEAQKLRQYLVGQRQIGREEAADAFIIAHPTSLPAIAQACEDSALLRYHFIDTLSAAQRIKLKSPPADSRAAPLFLHLAATAPRREQFAPTSALRRFHLYRTAQALYAISATLLLACALLVGREFYQASQLQRDARQFDSQAAALQGRYREIAATFPQLEVDLPTLRTVTDQYRTHLAQQALPANSYRPLARVLDQAPDIVLDNLDWKIARPDASGPQPPREMLVVQGHLAGAPGTARQTLERFDRFVADLGRLPGFAVQVTQRPLDLESARPLRGGDHAATPMTPPRFSLTLQRPLPPATP